MKITIKTHTGNYLTAVDGGGKGDPEGLPFNSVPFHTNATQIQDWELFTVEPLGDDKFAIRTKSGNYLTAVYGGRRTDPPGFPHNSLAIHTNAATAQTNEIFELVQVSKTENTFALKTPSGNYLTAINAGGLGDPPGQPFNSWPMHTNATQVQDWEQFEIKSINPDLSDASAHAETARKLGEIVGKFREDYGQDLRGIKKAATKTFKMDPQTSEFIRSIVNESDFMKLALASFPGIKTITLGFEGEASFILGGSETYGVAFDPQFETFLFFRTTAASLGVQEGVSVNFRLGFFDDPVIELPGWSVAADVKLALGAGVGLAGVKDWGGGEGVELSFGTGEEIEAAFSLGHTSNLADGAFPG